MDHERYRHMHGQSMSSMKKASFEIILKDKRQIAEGTMAFIFQKPDEFHFKAGQHVRMTLIDPPETDAEGDSRFLSIASSPQDVDLIFAVRMRDTAFKRILGHMQAGERVLIQILVDVPHGAFALHDDPLKPAVFLIGGIGVVPAYSMIKDAIEKKLPHKLFLFYSNRRPEDASFLDELQNLAKQNPNFKLIATMTEPEKSAKSWQGETGFINRAMLTKYVTDLKSPIYYIAGLPEMASAMKALLINLNIHEDNIQAEEFSGFDLNQMTSAVKPVWKKYVVLVVIAFMIILGIVFHTAVANSLSNAGLGVIIGLLLVLVSFKVVMVFKFRNVLGFRHGLKRK